MDELMQNRVSSVEAKLSSLLYACDFSSWKKPVVRALFPKSKVVFVKDASQVPADAVLVVWGYKPLPSPVRAGITVLRLEDGFLRSVGLGADLIRPLSWVVDRQGMYYDSSQRSDLEHTLLTRDFTSELLARAASLRELIISHGLTKYNVGSAVWQRPMGRGRVILVPGQVESDASIQYGTSCIRTNVDLLRSVRIANPEAYIIYKPHPDVTAGLRARGLGEEKATEWCDELVVDVEMGALLSEVDEVHVMTSLAGFEALLRGRAVTCYGQPFYAGWGLTKDIYPVARRTRVLSLDELGAGALILYPRYVSRKTGQLISPEQAMNELIAWRERSGGRLSLWRRFCRPILRRVVGVR